jgi:ABC-type sugar transport system permease subunit
MFLISTVLTVAAGLFYAASINSAGWAMQVCRYGDFFCMNPSWLITAAILSAIWACFMRVDRM